MDKKFPPEIKRFAKMPNIKKVFISDVSPTGPNDCGNCGGVGVFALFAALKGPFQSPGAPYQMEGSNSLTNHFDATVGKNGAWWVGITYTFPCPVCDGGQRPVEPERSYPVGREIARLVHPQTQEVLEY